MKKIISALLLISMVMTISISLTAADYAVDPGYDRIETVLETREQTIDYATGSTTKAVEETEILQINEVEVIVPKVDLVIGTYDLDMLRRAGQGINATVADTENDFAMMFVVDPETAEAMKGLDIQINQKAMTEQTKTAVSAVLNTGEFKGAIVLDFAAGNFGRTASGLEIEVVIRLPKGATADKVQVIKKSATNVLSPLKNVVKIADDIISFKIKQGGTFIIAY